MTPIHHTLSKAIEHYLSGTATAEEQQAVQDWYHSFNDEEIDVPASIIDLRTKVAQKIWMRLNETIQQEEQESPARVVAWYRLGWVRVAAVVSGLLIGGYWLFVAVKAPEKTAQENRSVVQPVLHDVAPGGDRAILTLADGSTIVLDSAANGSLAVQGNVHVTKLADGQITYQVSDRLSTDPGYAEASAGRHLPLTYNTITTPKGGQYQLVLSDGSKVWLNAASSIRYPTTFAANERKVEITGEAYFEIEKNRNKPFRVAMITSINGGEVEVLGTHFNINAYDDETAIKTTLLEGKVKVSHREPAIGSTILQPGEQASMSSSGRVDGSNKSARIGVQPVNVDETVAWKNGLFQFNNTDIKALMRQIARWYDIDVRYEGTVSSMHITGKAPRNISLATMLKILELSDVRYKIDGRVLTVR